ncbi:hypothetical protein SAMN05660903_00137 [Salegentibacter salinarum]|nr:hypothetical protein SAMN05660903_00137 [Salegentibacter salinarum]
MQDLMSVLFYVRKSKDKNATHTTVTLESLTKENELKPVQCEKFFFQNGMRKLTK